MKIPPNIAQLLPSAYRPSPLIAKPSSLNQQSRFSGLSSASTQLQSPQKKSEPAFLFKYDGKPIHTSGLLNIVG